MRSLAVLAMLVLGSGCGSCEDGPRVPFGVDAGTQAESQPAEPPVPNEPAFRSREGQSFPEGTRRVAIEGAPIEPADGDVRALLPVDLDADGDRDVLLVIAREGGLVLMHAPREDAAFAAPRELGRIEQAASECELRRATMRTVSPEYAVAVLDSACPTGSSESLWIVSVESSPRVRESMTLLPEDGRAEGDVRIALRAVDHDTDGHMDVLLDVSVTPAEASEGTRASIAWLDRPGGLARDTSEPEASIAALAQRARQALARDPAAALTAARQALSLHAVLCREAGAPRVRFGGADGVACRASEGAGRAAAVATAALARQGEVFQALEARQRLDGAAYRVAAADRRQADQALASLARTEAVQVVEGPAAIAPSGPDVRLPLIGFLDEERLLVRGVAPALYRVTDSGIAPSDAATPSRGDLVVTDPGGRFAVVDVRRTCEGHVLVIVRASEVVAGVVAGRAVAQPLLEPVAAPPGSACPDSLSAPLREDDGGWHVVGWAPQGVVAVRRDEVRVVPMTVEGQPAGDPNVIEPGTPPPAPLPAGRMAHDGGAYVLPTPIGIVVRTLGDGTTAVLRPEPWSAESPDIAVSPSGRRVAFVADGRVHVATVPE